MAKMSSSQFGKDVVQFRELDGKELSGVTATTGIIGFFTNLIWACTFGVALFLGYIITGIFSCPTIIGIPFSLHSFRLAGILFWPVGRRVVTKEMAKLVRERSATELLDKMRGSGLSFSPDMSSHSGVTDSW